MNFVRFTVATTNIFPIANSRAGGQLLTEFNLRSRETVQRDPNIKYAIGPSYTHNMEDFAISPLTDGTGTAISSTLLEIAPGECLLNGHYFQCLSSVMVDLAEANKQARLHDDQPLKGELKVGLRAMYSTTDTIAGSLEVENAGYYEGVQIVILPPEQFKLPIDSPDDEGAVTAHLYLGSFFYENGAIVVNTVTQNENKVITTDASRIGDFDKLLSGTYLTKTGLDPKKFYTFSGRGSVTGQDTWCDSTDSLIIWDRNPILQKDDPGLEEAAFGLNSKNQVVLAMPHKKLDFRKDATDSDKFYYTPKVIALPLADFNANTSGTISGDYTNNVKRIIAQIQNLYNLPNGKQRGFIEQLQDRTVGAENGLPVINNNWVIGDYILVGADDTVADISDDSNLIQSPSTIYVIIPNYVSKIEYVSNNTTGKVPESLKGRQLGRKDFYQENEDETPNTTVSETYNEMFGLKDGAPSATDRGQVGADYYVATYTEPSKVTYYYYKVSENAGPNVYSDPIYLTGNINLATTEMIGGFLNVPEDAADAGYVYLDSDGHLRLLDYDLLRTGVLAYQLGQDYEFGGGTDNESIQANLDEYVNDRVAFPNAEQLANSSTPNIINITIDLSAADLDEESNIVIRDIDSRFNTSVCVTLIGEANSNTKITFADCEKLRIINTVNGKPEINIYRCNLYYDSGILDYATTISNITFWYERYSDDDPNLLVEGMTIIEVDAPIIPDELDFWSDDTPNDNHFMYALQSITFSPDAQIVGAGLYMKNETTSNVSVGPSILVSTFTLPQGSGLTYPASKLTQKIKIDGSFITSYPMRDPVGYKVVDTNFTALINPYTVWQTSNNASGTISFFCNTMNVANFNGVTAGSSIESWDSNSFHVFKGSVIG